MAGKKTVDWEARVQRVLQYMEENNTWKLLKTLQALGYAAKSSSPFMANLSHEQKELINRKKEVIKARKSTYYKRHDKRLHKHMLDQKTSGDERLTDES